MSLQDKVMQEIKAAMKEKDAVALESLRAIKSALLLAQTEKGPPVKPVLKRNLKYFKNW